MASPRVRLLLLILGGLASLFLGWFLIASAADFFVSSQIRPKHRYYTSFRYVDFIWFYVFLSSVCLFLFFSLRAFLKRWVVPAIPLLGLFFALFLWLAIEDDIRFGRSIAPEIFFSLLILIFHVSIFFGVFKLLKLLTREQSGRLFR